MGLIRYVFGTMCVGLMGACSPASTEPSAVTPSASPSPQIKIMRTEFMESCRARPEYTSKKRAGTLDNHCKCIFTQTMKGLSDEEQIVAGIYLYGETHEAFRKRLKNTTPNPEAMMVAAKAVGKAAKVCR